MTLADAASDGAVAEIVARDAPEDLRARVFARLAEAPARRERRASRVRPLVVAGWTAAAAAIALAAALWLRPAPPTPPAAPVLAATQPIVEAAAAPSAPAPRRDLTPPPAPAERRAELVRAASIEPGEPYRFQPPAFVEPLATPPLISIAPLPEPRTSIEPIAINPLTFTPVTIAPLPSGR